MMRLQFSGNSLIRLVLVSMIGLMFVMGSGVPAQAAVEDVLLEKGIITKEDWLKIKAGKESAQGKNASPVTSSPSPATPSTAPAPPSNEGTSLKVIEREKEPTTGELISGEGLQKPPRFGVRRTRMRM